ncbi:MAG TPA: MarR family transcriptional regulator [Acidimicrobiales bacterium]|jgi:DNA-binding MarR family transcriptional regulator|nr:MarR family transcriptional regulator [Acidimicrobiales bacterium]
MDQIPPDAKFPFQGTLEGGRAQSVCFTLSQLGLENARQFGDLVGALGLEPRHFAVLRTVHGDEGQSQQVIGDHLGIPASTMVAIVDHLEGAGLLERRLRTSDRRTRTLHLTERGAALQAEAFAAAMQQEARICAGLEPEEREQLLGLLRRVSENLGVSASMLPDRGSGVRPQQF